MAEFVKGSKLNSEIESLFENATKSIVIISPYIKLHSRFIEILKCKKEDPNIEITIVFGKNEKKIHESIHEEDVKFLAEFPNISIKYEPRLHAKYYSNETTSILSSMNLYDYSQNNNIEFGIVTKTSLLGSIAGNTASTLDEDANNYFTTVIKKSQYFFKKIPKFENKMLGFSKKYIESEVEIDSIFDIFKNKPKKGTKPTYKKKYTSKKIGYCIRTGEEIEYNTKIPFSQKAYKSWEKFKNEEYPEKYCHYSGETSNGETSFSKPILKKNWRKSKN